MPEITEQELKELKTKAGAFDRFVAHLDKRKDVQNIDLMVLAGFCRNCLYKWYFAEAQSAGLDIDIEEAQQRIYGMAYSNWKSQFQGKATQDQLDAFNAITPDQTSLP